MVLNYIWIAFFVIAFLVALGRTIFLGDIDIWGTIMGDAFSMSATAFEISIGLTGILSLWMGLMKVGEQGGVIRFFSRIVSPLFSRLFPQIPKNHPAMGSIFMNVSANMLGLDNAATPLGLKAMQQLQSLNNKKDTATDSMLMFLILNASGLCLIPISVMMYRQQLGAANPTDVFMPILLATFLATYVGIIMLCIKQRINLCDKVLIAWLVGIALFIGGLVYGVSRLPQASIEKYSGFIANFIIFSIIIGFLCAAMIKRVNIFETFIEGAKEGFKTAVTIIPYLVAFLVAIAVFRASGALTLFTDSVASFVAWLGFDSQWVGALPTMLMKPLSGSGSRGMMIDAMTTYGPDAFVSRVAACVQGSTDTTFYILAVYFGSVGVRKTRYAVPFALLADVVGSISGVIAAYIFFG